MRRMFARLYQKGLADFPAPRLGCIRLRAAGRSFTKQTLVVVVCVSSIFIGLGMTAAQQGALRRGKG